MTDLLHTASTWLEGQRTKHLTQAVVYQRAADSVAVQATIGQTIFEIDGEGGAVLELEARDYLILAADLVLAGELVLPQRGDRIREARSGQTFVYEVIRPGDEPCWRWSDPYRQTVRIHTKQVDVEV